MAIDYHRATRTLARRDPVIGALIERHGGCGLPTSQHADPFEALVRAVISQQLSTKAAASIATRFEGLYGRFPSPSMVSRTSETRLRSVGLSGQKIGYLRDLCWRIEEGALSLDGLESMVDDEVVTVLTEVKGIGRWTAEMFLMFRLHRPDVLPVGDLGIVRAVQRAYRLRTAPTAARLTLIGEAWRPYRSIACWYLWASLQNAPLRD